MDELRVGSPEKENEEGRRYLPAIELESKIEATN
jgi:hypothetical protein